MSEKITSVEELESLAREMCVEAMGGRADVWDLMTPFARTPWLQGADAALAWFAARQPAPVDGETGMPGRVVHVAEMTRTLGGVDPQYLHVTVEMSLDHRPEYGPVVLREAQR